MKINIKIMLLVTITVVLAAATTAAIGITRLNQTGKTAIDHLEALKADTIERMKREGDERLAAFRQEMLRFKMEYLKSQVQTASSILKKIHGEQGDGGRDSAAKLIESMRYGAEGKDYFWINDSRPFMVMHPYKPELNGTDLTENKDPNGKALFVEFAKTCQKSGEGFVDYYWPKYGADKPQPKLSFVFLFKPWDWIIGSGIYIDDIDALVAEKKTVMDAQIAKAKTDIENNIHKIESSIHQKVSRVLIEIPMYSGILLLVVLLAADWVTRLGITVPINKAIEGLKQSSHYVSTAAGEIASATQSMAESVSEQAAATEESSASLNEMADMCRQTTDLTGGADNLMKENIEKSVSSLKSLTQLMNDITQVAADSDSISQIIKEIESIAFQTSLLALNAAVEAARAGEAGAGFAVVAEEVKNLAHRTTEAADTTQELLTNTLARVKQASESVGTLNSDFSVIIESATVLGEKTAAITNASNNQAQGVDQISRAVEEINRSTQQLAAISEESSATAEELSAQAEELNRLVGDLMRIVGGKGTARVEGEA